MSLAKWLRLPSRIAVLLGMGALSATGAPPAMAEPELGKGPLRVPQQSAKSFGEVLIWSEGGRIYFSESGNEAQELRLGDTPQAGRLRELLVREGAVAELPRVRQRRPLGRRSVVEHSGQCEPRAESSRLEPGRKPSGGKAVCPD
jgi:hypothetical protein